MSSAGAADSRQGDDNVSLPPSLDIEAPCGRLLSDDEADDAGRLVVREENADLAAHDFRAGFPLCPKEGRSPAKDGPDAYNQPCPRCGCKQTRERTWTPPMGECPAAELAAKVAKLTGGRNAFAWPQYVVCMACPLCRAGAREPQACPSGAACGPHWLGDFVCRHVSSQDDGALCAPCRQSGKFLDCPCDICACARRNLNPHPLRWRLGAYDAIKKRTASMREKQELADLAPCVARKLLGRGVVSQHVHAAVARALVQDSRPDLLPAPLRQLLSEGPDDVGGAHAEPGRHPRAGARWRAVLLMRAGRATARAWCSRLRRLAAAGAPPLDAGPALPPPDARQYWMSRGAAHGPYRTPPQSFKRQRPSTQLGDRHSPRLDRASPTCLIRVLRGLRADLEEDVLRAGVMIASHTEHAKYARLQRIVRGFHDNAEDLTMFITILVRERGEHAVDG
jgi:hypothetical protein